MRQYNIIVQKIIFLLNMKNKIQKIACIFLFVIGFVFNIYAQEIHDFNKTKLLAEQGYPKAQYNLGELYYFGEGTLMDKKQAFFWIKKSAEQGYAAAQYNLGVMYDEGKGTLINKKQAFYWYSKSAEQGNTAALFNLGVMYNHGEGTLINKKQAAKYIKLAYENSTEAESKKIKSFWEKYELWKY